MQAQSELHWASRVPRWHFTRKEATQSYRGRAAVHLHGLKCLCREHRPHEASREGKRHSATGREGDPLCGYVLDGQTGRTGSGWPQHLGENEYDSAQDKVRLHHNAWDRRLGVRGYLPEVLDVLKCHQDLQLDRGSGLMLKYTATYLPKFSDGPGKELMDDTTAAAMAQLVESSSPFIRENQRCGFSSLTRPSPCSSWGVRCSRSLRATLVWR